MEYNPGQIFIDKDHKYDIREHNYLGIEYVYLLLSYDIDRGNLYYWRCAVFQDWEFGGYIRFLTEREIDQLHYMGHIKDIKEKTRVV